MKKRILTNPCITTHSYAKYQRAAAMAALWYLKEISDHTRPKAGECLFFAYTPALQNKI